MSLTPLVPDSVPLILGTRQLQEEAIELRRGQLAGPVDLIEPPIDTDADHPGVDGSAFARDLGLDGAGINIVVVSRLSLDLKLDGLERVIDAVGQLAERFPVRLVIVGDGEARNPLERRADAVNSRLGRCAITLAGPLLDPRPAYAAADIVVGMGGSILRGMAFGKPTVVQGESGFSEVLSPDTRELFLWQGFWGHGDGQPGCDLLRNQLERLLADDVLRRDLGSYGRRFVEERFSLRSAAPRLEQLYEQAARMPLRRRLHVREAARVGATAALTELRYHLPGNRARERAEAARVAAAADGKSGTRESGA